MSRWRKSLGRQYDYISPNILKNKKCKDCGSKKWAVFSDDGGRTWTCWGHRKDATPEERQKEEQRQREDNDRAKRVEIKGQIFRQKVQNKRHAKSYKAKTVQLDSGKSKYDWLFE